MVRLSQVDFSDAENMQAQLSMPDEVALQSALVQVLNLLRSISESGGHDAQIKDAIGDLEQRVKLLLSNGKCFAIRNTRMQYNPSAEKLPPTGPHEQFLQRIINYIEENIDDPALDIAALANELNMSSSNLYRKVKSITGVSSIDFVIHHKMKYAAQLLECGEYSIKEIAFKVGFSDARYFSTRFKKYFKYTPTEYVATHMSKVAPDDRLR